MDEYHRARRGSRGPSPSSLSRHRSSGEDMENALVVEDEQNVARICVRLLESMGMTSVVVATGQEALSVISSAAPLSFAYVDVGLPDGSGLGVAAEARR